MRAVLRSLKRNGIALGMAQNETRPHYYSRLRFELRRRSNQLLARVNPFDRDQYRLEKLAGPIGIWPHLQQYQLNILTGLGLKPHHSVLDIGCGPITAGLGLIAYLKPGNYLGLDALPEPLAESYRRVAKHSLVHKNPTFVCSSSFGKSELGSRMFDYIWMSQLSYHLDDDQTARLFAQAQAMMSSTSHFLFDVIDPEISLEPDYTWRGFSYHVRSLEFYEAMARRFSLSLQRRGRIVDYGYPEKINLSANILLELRK